MRENKNFLQSMLMVLLLSSIFTPYTALAQENTPTTGQLIKGRVEKVLNEESQMTAEGEVIHQKLDVNIGEKNVVAEFTIVPLTGRYKVVEGDRILVYGVNIEDESKYFVADYDREKPIVLLVGVFVGVVTLVTRKWGVYALIGLVYSFTVIFQLILPQILKGTDPLLTALAGSVLIAPVTFALSHGLGKKTLAGLLGTFIALSVTGLLAVLFTQATHLSGFGSEESLFLQISQGNKLNMRGVFLAGIIIGTLGILDDVTISQASIVKQLKIANPELKKTELYKLAMSVGHDHISSAVNTLVLVYAGASMPLLLIFLVSNQTFGGALNYQVISEEIVRTLVSSVGLIIAVPITTLISTGLLDSKAEDCNEKTHAHHH